MRTPIKSKLLIIYFHKGVFKTMKANGITFNWINSTATIEEEEEFEQLTIHAQAIHAIIAADTNPSILDQPDEQENSQQIS